MKAKVFFRGVIIAFCAVLTAGMMSCKVGKNTPDDPKKTAEEEQATPGAYAQYAFATNDDMINLFYIKIEYLDSVGKMQNVTLDEPSWAVRMDSKTLPAKFGMRVNITMRGMADLTKYKEVAIDYTASYLSSAKDAQGKATGDLHKNSREVQKTLRPNEVSLWVENYGKKPVEFWFEYDENGNFKLTE